MTKMNQGVEVTKLTILRPKKYFTQQEFYLKTDYGHSREIVFCYQNCPDLL